MFSLETALLGVALALDAAVVSFTIGILNQELSHAQKISRGFMLSGLFGFFQFLMIWIGSKGGFYLSFSSYGYLFHLVVALIFLVIGIRVFQESFRKDEAAIEWGIIPLLILALATSVDALAAGVSMGTLPMAYVSALEIGVITFFMCLGSYFASNFLSSFPTHWLLKLAAVIFFYLGGRIFVQYYF